MKIKKIMSGIIATLLSITTLLSCPIVYAEDPEPKPVISKDTSLLERVLFEPLGSYDDVMSCSLCRIGLIREEAKRFLDKQKEEFIRTGISSSGREFFKISEYKYLGSFIPPISESVDPLVFGVYLYLINEIFKHFPNIKDLLFQILCSFDRFDPGAFRENKGSFNIGVGCSTFDDDEKEIEHIVNGGKKIEIIRCPNIYGDILGLELNLRAYSYPASDGKRIPKSVNTILEEYLYKKRLDPDASQYMSKPTCPFNIIAEPAIRAMSRVFYQLAFYRYAATRGGINSGDYDRVKEIKDGFCSLVSEQLECHSEYHGEYYGKFISQKEFADYFCCMWQMRCTDDPIIKNKGLLMLDLLGNLDSYCRLVSYSKLMEPIKFLGIS